MNGTSIKLSTTAFAALALAALLPFGARAADAAKPAAYKIVKVYSDGDAFWDHGTFDEVSKRLFLGRENGITTIDTETGQPTDRLLAGKQVHKVVLPSAGRAIATEGGNADAIVFERDTGKILKRISTGKK